MKAINWPWLGCTLACLALAACGSVPPVDVSASAPAVEVPFPPPPPAPEEPVVKELRLRVEKLSAQLADAHRRNTLLNEEYRHADAALRESQRRVEELQLKLDALRAIDRDTRPLRRH